MGEGERLREQSYPELHNAPIKSPRPRSPPNFWRCSKFLYNHIGKSYIAIAIGDVVKGVLVGADSEYRSVHLQSWGKSSYREWYYAQPPSYPPEGISLNRKAIFDLPLLGRKNMMEHEGRDSQLVIQPGRLRNAVKDVFLPPPDDRSPPKGKGEENHVIAMRTPRFLSVLLAKFSHGKDGKKNHVLDMRTLLFSSVLVAKLAMARMERKITTNLERAQKRRTLLLSHPQLLQSQMMKPQIRRKSQNLKSHTPLLMRSFIDSGR